MSAVMLVDHVPALALQRDEAADDRRARLGVEDAERQVLQLLAHPLHAHPAGERRVDVHRLARLLALLVGAHRPDRAHVVQPVGELDQDHPQVLGHRHEELAEVLGLLGLGRGELQVGQLGDAVHQLGHLGAELARDLGIGRAGVLDRVVQQRGDDGRVVELHLGQDRGDRDGMGEIGLARVAQLPLVHLRAVVVGPLGSGPHRCSDCSCGPGRSGLRTSIMPCPYRLRGGGAC